MRNVEDGELGDAVGMEERDAPGHGGAPIVPGEEDSLLAELIGDGDDVRDKLRERVRFYARRFAAEVVPALVGDDDAKTGCRERINLFVPGIPEFREAVKKKNDRTIFWPSGDSMETDRTILKGQLLQVRTQARRRRRDAFRARSRRSGDAQSKSARAT